MSDSRTEWFLQAINKTSDKQHSLKNEIEYIQTVAKIYQNNNHVNQWKKFAEILSTFKKHHAFHAVINSWRTNEQLLPNFRAFDDFKPNGDIEFNETTKISKEALCTWVEILLSTDLPPEMVNASIPYVNILIHSTIPSIFNFFLTNNHVEYFVQFVMSIYQKCQDPNSEIQSDAYMQVVESAFESPLFLKFLHNVFLVHVRTLIDNPNSPHDFEGVWNTFVSRFRKYASQCPQHIKELLVALDQVNHDAAIEVLRQGITKALESPARFGLASFHEWRRCISHDFIDFIHSKRIEFFEALLKIVIERGGTSAVIFETGSQRMVNAVHDLLLVQCSDTFDKAVQCSVSTGSFVPCSIGDKYEMVFETPDISMLSRGSFEINEQTNVPKEAFNKFLREFLKFAPQIPHYTSYPGDPPSILDIFKSYMIFAGRGEKVAAFNALVSLEFCDNAGWLNLETEEDFEEYMSSLDDLVRHHIENEQYLSNAALASSVAIQLDGLRKHTEELRKHVHCVMQEYRLECAPPLPDANEVYENPSYLYEKYLAQELQKTNDKITPKNSSLAEEIAVHRLMSRISGNTFAGHRPDLRAKDGQFSRIIGEHTHQIIEECKRLSPSLKEIEGQEILGWLSERLGVIYAADTTPLQKWNDFAAFSDTISQELQLLGIEVAPDQLFPLIVWIYALSGISNVVSTLIYMIDFVCAMPGTVKGTVGIQLLSSVAAMGFTMLRSYGLKLTTAELSATFQVKGEIVVFGGETSIAKAFIASFCHINESSIVPGGEYIGSCILDEAMSPSEQYGLMLRVHYADSTDDVALKKGLVVSFAGASEAEVKDAWSVQSKAGERGVLKHVLCDKEVDGDKKNIFGKISAEARRVEKSEFLSIFQEIGNIIFYGK